jgi:O-antigen/teichoic acid export membrane protein
MSITASLQLLFDLGLIQSLYREKEIKSDKFLQILWTVRILQGAFISIIVLAIGSALNFSNILKYLENGSIFTHADFSLILISTAVIPLISALESPNKYVAARRLEFRTIAMSGIITQCLVAICTISLAYMFRNVWALFFGTIALHLLNTINSYMLFPGPKMRIRLQTDIFMRFWEFGKWVGLSSISTFIESNIQRIYISLNLGAAAFGLYAVALVWMESLLSIIRIITGRISPPAFAEMIREDKAQIHILFDEIQTKVDLTIIFFVILIILIAPTVCDIIYINEYRQLPSYLYLILPMLFQVRYDAFFQLQVIVGNSLASWYVSSLRLVGVLLMISMLKNHSDPVDILIYLCFAPTIAHPYLLYLCWRMISKLQRVISIVWIFGYIVAFFVIQNSEMINKSLS